MGILPEMLKRKRTAKNQHLLLSVTNRADLGQGLEDVHQRLNNEG